MRRAWIQDVGPEIFDTALSISEQSIEDTLAMTSSLAYHQMTSSGVEEHSQPPLTLLPSPSQR